MPRDTYGALLDGIGEIISSGKDLSSQSRGRRLARSYWEIGDAVHLHLLTHQGKSTYGESLIERLSKDLSLDQSLIYTMIRFRRAMPILGRVARGNLTPTLSQNRT